MGLGVGVGEDRGALVGQVVALVALEVLEVLGAQVGGGRSVPSSETEMRIWIMESPGSQG